MYVMIYWTILWASGNYGGRLDLVVPIARLKLSAHPGTLLLKMYQHVKCLYRPHNAISISHQVFNRYKLTSSTNNLMNMYTHSSVCIFLIKSFALSIDNYSKIKASWEENLVKFVTQIHSSTTNVYINHWCDNHPSKSIYY